MNAPSYLHRQMRQVKDELLKMAGLVEEAIHDAGEALSRRDAALAQRVIEGDMRIDALQNWIESRCITLLATQQPVAVDLRFLFAVIKICSHLERMGDHAKKMAKSSLALKDLSPTEVPARLLTMVDLAREMTRMCIDALAQNRVDLAQRAVNRDDEMDELDRQLMGEMIQWMASEQRLVRRGVEFILVARHLERVGDEATNIAEEVVYLVEGLVIRHQQGKDGQEGERDTTPPFTPPASC